MRWRAALLKTEPMKFSSLIRLFPAVTAALLSHSAVAQTAAGPDSNAQLAPLHERHAGMGRTLEDFYNAALEYSPGLQVAQGRWDISSARRQQVNGQFLPQISAAALVSDNRQDTLNRINEYSGERLTLQLRQVLFDWSLFSRRGQAYLIENQAEAEYYEQLSRLLTEVSERYLDVLQAQDALTSIESELAAVNEQLEQVKRLYDRQMVQITDLYDAQARFSAVEAEKVRLESDVILTRESLRAVSGLSVGDIYTLGDNPDLPPIEGNVEQWVQRARDNNHAIQARGFAVEAADRRVSESRGAYMPRVNLIVQQQRSDLGFDNMPIQRTDTGYIGVDVSIPLYAGGSNRASVREAVSNQGIARNELRQLNLEVAEQTRLYFLRLQAAQRQIRAAEALLESRTLAARSRQRGFELSVVTNVDVLDALREQFMAERDLQRIRYDYLRLGLYLRRDAGTLSADDLLDISRRLQAPDSN
jgi:outer membrane protein